MRANPNFDVIKEPRGFIKCLEVVLAIFAFSCAVGYTGTLKITQEWAGTPVSSHQGKASFSYPFSGAVNINLDWNGTLSDVSLDIDQRSSTEFFVVIGVFSFLYSLVMIIYYILFEEDNSRDVAPTSSPISPPVIDFAVGTFFALFWFFSSIAFAAAVSSIQSNTDVAALTGKDGILERYCARPNYICILSKAKYATLTVAILLGFLNVFVWAGNIWFLWKETPWHRQGSQPATISQQQQQQQQQPQQTPAAAAI